MANMRTCRLCYERFTPVLPHSLMCETCTAYNASGGFGVGNVMQYEDPNDDFFDSVRVLQKGRPNVSVPKLIVEAVEHCFAIANLDEPDIYELGKLTTKRLAEMLAQYAAESPWTASA